MVQHVATGHRRAVSAANAELLAAYWGIGRAILDRQNREGYGTKVIDRLSADVRKRFPEARGYSPRNLKYMRAFAAAWPDPEVVQRSVAQLPWRHHIALLEKLDTPELRRWYGAEALELGWSRDVLAHHIDGRLHERVGRAITNFGRTLPEEQSDLARQATRDPYLFDFLGATEVRGERELEQGLVNHVREFLLELGQGFAFVGRQVRLELGGDEFFADLLFYHVPLHRYIVIELKAVKFEAGFLGQLGMYRAAVDDLLSGPGDNPAIGLLLCRTKNDIVAEYALRDHTAPMGVAEWTTAITTTLPAEVASSLPSVETLESELAEAPDDRPDAVAENESAVREEGGDVLAQIARDLVGIMRRDVRTDWTVRDDVRAKLRSSIKRLLIKYDYPPDQQPGAIKLVMEQMEQMAPRYAEEHSTADGGDELPSQATGPIGTDIEAGQLLREMRDDERY